MLNITAGGMSGGYRTYLSRLVPLLAEHPDVEALLVGMPQTVEIAEWRERASSVQWVSLRCALAARGREVGPEARKAIERFAPDVIFIPTARYWSLDGVPVVNMVQNMMPTVLHCSTYSVERLKNWLRFRELCRAVANADRVIAVSQFVKDYLTDRLRLSDDRIGVTHFGADLFRDESMRQPVAVSHEWKGRFVFTAGLIYPYRGLEDLIGAWGHLRTGSDRPPLVIAGKVGQGMNRYYRKLLRMVDENGLASHIRFVGVLDREEMAWCYRNCAAFVMTSRVEACPNIALEAMAHGCVCISTDNPPMPEIFGKAARYYRAANCEELIVRLEEIWDLPANQREGIRCLTVARARRFTWEACCQGTMAELQKATGRRWIDSGSAE